jgi:hypothetical protein
VGEYDISKYGDFGEKVVRHVRASPALITQREFPTFNTAPVGAYDLPALAQISRNWSFGKIGKNQANPHAGRPVPAEVLFRSSGALELRAVQQSPAPDTYDVQMKKDERMGVFTTAKRDKEKKLKEAPVGPGDYMKDNNFIKSDRAALLNVVGRFERETPFRRHQNRKVKCDRLERAEGKQSVPWNLTSSSWGTAHKQSIFSQTDNGPGFKYGAYETWFPEDDMKRASTMRDPSIHADERFAVHRMTHLGDRIWGPF